MNIKIIPYDEIYDENVNQLERIVFQGKSIQLRILKKHFLDRAIVFKKYYPILTIDERGIVLGTCIAAQTTLKVNDDIFFAGIGFDVKVHPNYRSSGIGRMMAKFVYKNFFKPENLIKNFITLKNNNNPVIRLLSKVNDEINLYDFVYLTISTKSRIEFSSDLKVCQQLFYVKLYDREEIDSSYYKVFTNGLGYFNTHKMYQLEILKISWIYKLGFAFFRKIKSKRKIHLPEEGEKITFSTLFNHTAENITHINDVLKELEDAGIKYLMVCCKKNDMVFNALKKNAINCTDYYILSDFTLNKTDRITIDVRCL
ncbi:hypothetical protein [Flavobacterium maritimum]|uniref:hypothetical protein n=1 Tax=Flavobacterium maritimum TaxID=3149042 RepID=UPI0032B543EE